MREMNENDEGRVDGRFLAQVLVEEAKRCMSAQGCRLALPLGKCHDASNRRAEMRSNTTKNRRACSI